MGHYLTDEKMRRLCLIALFMGISFVALSQETSCGDGIDNDGDGFIDCFDGDCANSAACDDSYIGKDKLCQTPPTGSLLFGMKLGATSRNRTTLSYGRMVVGDLDRDGLPEMVTTHHNDRKVYILNGADLSIKTEINTIGNPEYFDHAIANLDDDNCAEIFIVESEVRRECDSRGRNCRNNTYYMVTSFDCNGNQLWRTQAYEQPFTIGLADFDHDGQVELYYKNEILDAKTGEVLVPGSGNWNSFDSGPVAVDILPDGACTECAGLELVLGGEIYAPDLTPRTPGGGSVGTPIKRFNDLPGLGGITYFPKYVGFGYVNSMTSVADYNLDGNLDVIMNGATSSSATSTTTVFFWDVANNQFKTFQPKQPNGSSWPHGTGRINLADVDGDGKMNATFVSGARIYSLKEDFTLLWQKTIAEQTSGFTSTTVFDFNNDNAVEIVYRDEANLYIIDGKTGNAFTTVVCRSRTANDYPIVVDVDADGATEICVSCATNDNADISNNGNTPFGQIRTYKSSLEPWVSARKVWNQYAYFNVNVNDDLTIPQVQQKHHLVFSEDVCGTGENRALNSFLNQSAILDSKGCKTYPSADVAFLANPSLLNIVPPTCPDQDFLVSFTLENIGDLDLNGDFPVTFYSGDPRLAGAVKLSTEIITFANFKIGDQINIVDMPVAGTGGPFTLFAVLNDDGSTVPTPISLPNSGFVECNFSNNIVYVSVNPLAFPLTASSTDHLQCGAGPSPPNGSMRAFKPEGAVEQTVGYTFYWFDGTTAGSTASADHVGSQINNVPNGTYTVYAMHDAYQCGSDTVQVVVGQQSVSIGAMVNVDKPYTSCTNPDGQLSVTPGNGAVSDYTYQWFEGTVFGTSPILSNSNVLPSAKALTYSVLVTQISTGCETLESGTVPDMTVTPSVTTGFTTANCAPVNSGAASANVEGVTAGYTFYWYDGPTSKPTEDFRGDTYGNIPAGNYTVRAVDNATGCRSAEAVVTVPMVTGITVTASVSAQQTSCTTPNGAVSASVGGTTAGYTFRWFKGNNTINQIGNTPAISGLAAGVYTVEATNVATGCVDTDLVTIVDNIRIPIVTPTLVADHSYCFPANGAVSATATGSPGPHVFYWFDGNIATPDTAAATFKGTTYTGLSAGFYTVVAVDVNNRCVSPRRLIQVGDQTVPPVLTTSTVAQTSCNPLAPNGQASAHVGGVTAGYKFRWFAGSDTSAFVAQSVTISNRVAGTYTVKAVDVVTGCYTTSQVTITNNMVTPVVTAVVDQNLTVCNASNGQVSAHVAGATAGFDFYWFNGNPAVTDSASADFKGAVWTGRPVGPYTVIAVGKATRCVSAKRSASVTDNTVLPVIATTSVNQTSCNPLAPNGQASANVGGVTTGYKFRWFAGADTTTFITQAAILTGRVAGTYTVKAVNIVTGCYSTRQVTITNNFVTPVVTAVVDQNLTVCNASNGQVSANVAGATAGFDFYWFAGNPSVADSTTADFEGAVWPARPVGAFTVIAVASATRCVSIKRTVSVVDNTTPPVVVAVSPDDNTACDPARSNGSISAHVGGVTTDHFFHIFRGQNTHPANEVAGSPSATIATLEAGIYTVQAIDKNTGCSATTEVTVNNNIALPVLNAVSTNVMNCSPVDGSITASVNIGLPSDYTFTWYSGNAVKAATDFPGQTTEVLSGVGAGTYTVSAFNNALGCDVQAPVVINVVADPSTAITITDVPADLIPGSFCNNGDGQLGAQASSPTNTGGFTFSWFAGDKNSGMVFQSNGAVVSPTHSRISSILSGRYTVIALDNDTGCQDSLAIDLPYVDEASLATINITPQTDCANPDGSFEVTVNPGPIAVGLGATQASYRLDVFQNGLLVKSVPGVDPGPTLVSGLSAGAYTVVAVETQVPPLTGCASKANDIVIGDATLHPVIAETISDNKNCFGASAENGSIILDVDGGADPNDYTFDWHQGKFISDPALPVTKVPVPQNAAINIGGGFYTVEVVNKVTGCETVETFHINHDPYVISILNADVIPTHQTDCAPENGSAEITDVQIDGVSGGLAGFTFKWFESDGVTMVPSSGAAPAIATPLRFGNYYVRATNTASNCQSALKQFVVLDQTLPPVIDVTSIINNSNCTGATPNGSVTIGVNGSADPITDFTIEWFEGTGTAVALGTNVGAIAGVNNEIAQALPAGTYTVRVTDNTTAGNSCGAMSTFTISDDLPVIAIHHSDISIAHQTNCSPVNGSAQVPNVFVNGVASGVAGFAFEWLESDGATVIAGSGNGATIGVALGAGNYFVRTTSLGSGCASPVTAFTINDVHVNPVIASTVIVNNSNCTGSNPNGSVTIEVNGGADPIADFTIEWFEGAGTTIPLGSNFGLTAGVNNEIAQALPAGTYTVRVTDNTSPSNSCGATATFTINDDFPVIGVEHADIAITHQSDCVPLNGSAFVTEITVDGVGTGSTSDYTFEWLHADAIIRVAGTGETASPGVPLAPARYFVRAKSRLTSCLTSPTAFTIEDRTPLPSADMVMNNPNIACEPGFTGELSVSVTEGATTNVVAGYTFDWFTGKNNINPADFVASGTVISNLQQGDYTVRVTDTSAPGLGCVATATLPVKFESTNFSSTLNSVVQAHCAPMLDGSLTVTNITETIAGTSTTYSMTNLADRARFDFQWFDAGLNPLSVSPNAVNGLHAINNAAAGQYYVKITNAMGCSAELTAAVIDDLTAPPVITLDDFLNPAICVMPETSGYLQVSADNSLNFSDYTFEWFAGADDNGTRVEPNNATLGNILYNQPLQYTVRVTDNATNCSEMETYTFRVDTVQIQVLASAVARTNCLVDDGSLFATTLSGGGSLYSYAWYSGSTTTGIPVYTTKEVANAPIGEYTVVAIDPNHSFCVSAPYTIRVTDARALPNVMATQRNPLTYCDPANPNGVAFASVNNNAAGFTLDWYRENVNGSPIYRGSEVTGLASGTYVVKATDVLTGCDNTATVLIENNPVNVPEPTVVVVSHHTNCVDADGVLSASVDGNTADYLLQWYDGNSVKNTVDQTGQLYRNLEDGFYTTTATDKRSGCVSEPVVTEVLPFREVPEFDIETRPTNCEQNIGEATLVLKNDVQIFSVEWNIAGDIQFGTMLSDLPKGEFTVRATTYQQCFTDKTFTIYPEVLVFNGVSRNNDGQNDYFEIACIQDFPNNNVKIFNRAGTLVYEANGYNNQDVFFDGVSNKGLSLLGNELPDGTYFYIIDKGDGSEPRSGYLELLK